MYIKRQVAINLQPFRVPNYVLTSDENVKFPLVELDESTLHELCDEFRANVLEKAKKQRPIFGGKRP